MNKNELIENRLKDSLDTLTPAYEESLYEKPVQAAHGDEWYLKGTERFTRKKDRSYLLPALAAAFALIMMVSGLRWYSLYLKTYATVYLDLNPSLSVEINAKEKVRDIIAANEDAEIILEGLNLKNTDVEVAVDAILGSMLKHGYIDEVHNILLLSTECENREYGNALKDRLSGGMNEYLSAFISQSCVLKQEIDTDQSVDDMAEKYGISPGKASLILKAAADDPSLDIEALAKLPVNELVRQLYDAGFDLKPYSDQVEDLLEAHGFDDDPYEHMYEDDEDKDHDEDDLDGDDDQDDYDERDDD